MAKRPRNRHQPTHIDRELTLTPDLLEILAIFDGSDRYEYLPRNWADAFAPLNPKTGKLKHPERYRHYLGELTCTFNNVKYPLLARFTLSRTDSFYEMMKYYRTPAGDRLAAVHGRPKLTYHQSKEPDLHQLFGCLRRASLELGVRADPNFSLDGPREILSHPKMGDHDAKSPFLFHTTLGRYTPDDKPLVVRRHAPKESKLLLFEDDRSSEGTVPSDTSTRLDEKFAKIVEVWRRRLFEDKYGHKAALLLFCTVGEIRARNVREYLHRRFGPLSYVLIKAFPEFKYLMKTINVTTKAWDTPWMRPGYPDYSLTTFSEV